MLAACIPVSSPFSSNEYGPVCTVQTCIRNSTGKDLVRYRRLFASASPHTSCPGPEACLQGRQPMHTCSCKKASLSPHPPIILSNEALFASRHLIAAVWIERSQ